jgi:putative addiction module CopG family antidote
MTIHVSLPEELEQMVHAQVDSGFYKSASEVVREALRDFFAERSAFSPEQVQWIRDEIGPRLEI